LAERLHPFPNGAAAMGALARGAVPGELGCTQITEIKSTPGVVLVGPLPAGFDLATIYTVAVCTRARDPDLARKFAALVSDPAARARRPDSCDRGTVRARCDPTDGGPLPRRAVIR
jgi:molybdate transport system substrate-binding protein